MRVHAGVNQRAEVVVASAACGVFEIGSFLFGFFCNITGSRMKFQTVFGRQLGDKFLVGVRGFSAQFVIEVYGAEDNSQPFAQFQQQKQQGHGIRAPGNGDAHTIARPQKLLRFHVVPQLLAQRRAHGLKNRPFPSS